MAEIIAGNACTLLACASDAVSGTRKKNEQILAVQILSQVFYGAGNIILKGYSGTAQNAVAILRNLAAIKKIRYKAVEWILIVLGVALGVLGIVLSRNAHGFFDWLPIAANLEYSVAIFRFKDNERNLKLAFIINMLVFSVFSFGISNYVGGSANIIVAAITAVSIIKADRRVKAEGSEADEAAAE